MSPVKKQLGSTLIVALVMLVLLTLLAVSAINSTTSSIQVVGNAQFSEEASAVAQQAIEKVISSNFTTNLATTAISEDINKDGTPDYTGRVEVPVCTSSIKLSEQEINSSIKNQFCRGSGALDAPVIAGPSGPTSSTLVVCFKQTWDIQSGVSDISTGASSIVHQGVYLRVPTNTCP